jgi:hypothetical protein
MPTAAIRPAGVAAGRPHNARVRARPPSLPGSIAVIAAAAATGAAGTAAAGPSPQQLQNRISGLQRHEGGLRSSIQSDTASLRRLQGPIEDLLSRLDALETSLAIERRQLDELQGQLRAARARLLLLQSRLARDRAALRAQLVADYESSPPDLVTVVLDSRGFADLLERVDVLRRIEHGNVRTVLEVRSARAMVARQVVRLSDLEARQRRATNAILVQRQEVARVRLGLIARRRSYARDRALKQTSLGALRSRRRRLEQRLSRLVGPMALGGLVHDGIYGFFQYPGTNYSVGDEPGLAARLNRLGKALHLHLIGISGYRSPQHSVEVGGFADDPHTRGEASDTPGVEGVAEATLERFGLTRPFGGAAEANHIQLLGG